MADAGREFGIAITMKQIIDEYKKSLDISLERALDKCADAYIAELERTAPRNVGVKTNGKPYHESFVSRMNKYGTNVYVGNSKTVSSKEHPVIPLINLLEYGRVTESGDRVGMNPHMNEALYATADKLLEIVKDEIERVK